jgi:carbamoyltransferase
MRDAGPVLGFSVSHDAGAAVVHHGRIVAAVNEERLTGRKGQSGVPRLSIDAVLDQAGLDPGEVRHIAWPTLKKTVDVARNVIPNFPSSVLAGSESENAWFKAKLVGYFGLRLSMSYGRTVFSYAAREASIQKLFPKATIDHFDHHLSHAACAFYSSGWERCLAVTADAQGDYTCAMISEADARGVRPICRSLYPHSPGTYYLLLTEMMGFVSCRHEGKVVGLAAYGNADSPAYDEIRGLLFHRDGRLFTPGLDVRFPRLFKRLAASYSREDLAAVFQRLLEEAITSWIAHHVKRSGLRKVAVAGGVFANVKLNQRIAELGDVAEVYVFPHMSDGGLSVGGAYLLERALGFDGPATRLDDLYLDRDYSEEEMHMALASARCLVRRPHDIEQTIAGLLAEGRVVARFNGPMEFGPRALGNRSIFCHAGDPAVNISLNEKLRRTEFMPFAPLTIDEDADEMYRNIQHHRFAARFMTMTFECTEKMRRVNPAAVHVDGTARPQVLDAATNPSAFKILRAYKNLTGNGTIVNTSFNVHEQPIVRTPADAVRAFVDAQLDYLAMGPFLVEPDRSGDGRPER